MIESDWIESDWIGIGRYIKHTDDCLDSATVRQTV